MSEDKEATEKNEQGKHSRRIFIAAVVGVALLVASGVAYFTGIFGGSPGEKAAVSQNQKEKYTCGMHPWIISDKPGNCPVCGMTLTKVEGEAQAPTPAKPQAEEFFAQGEAKKGERKILYYRNPMNPSITSPVPAKDEMGMDFVPVYSDEVAPPGG
ncbi:MAG TPA: heavy metal-binding domain-containing protein, partial [Candidatus Methylomirabilis sp.]